MFQEPKSFLSGLKFINSLGKLKIKTKG